MRLAFRPHSRFVVTPDLFLRLTKGIGIDGGKHSKAMHVKLLVGSFVSKWTLVIYVLVVRKMHLSRTGVHFGILINDVAILRGVVHG